jgi:hypothetical protein
MGTLDSPVACSELSAETLVLIALLLCRIYGGNVRPHGSEFGRLASRFRFQTHDVWLKARWFFNLGLARSRRRYAPLEVQDVRPQRIDVS